MYVWLRPITPKTQEITVRLIITQQVQPPPHTALPQGIARPLAKRPRAMLSAGNFAGQKRAAVADIHVPLLCDITPCLSRRFAVQCIC